MGRKQSGMTLVEVLAAITLSSFIIVLVFSLLFFVKKQSDTQHAVIENQSNLRLAMSVVSQELRKYNANNILLSTDKNANTVMTINNGTTKQTYSVNSSKELQKNDGVLAAHVARFLVTKATDETNKYTITIRADQTNKQCNQGNKQLENCMLSTSIYIRQ